MRFQVMKCKTGLQFEALMCSVTQMGGEGGREKRGGGNERDKERGFSFKK